MSLRAWLCKVVLPLAGVGALIFVGYLWRWDGHSLEAALKGRSIRDFQVRQLPQNLPDEWRDELSRRLNRLPDIPILDAKAEALLREAFSQVSWIRPETVDVQWQTPAGLNVIFEPRSPLLGVMKDGSRIAVTSRDGTILPPGLPAEVQDKLLIVLVDHEMEVPAPGRRMADPLVQEAIRAAPEIYALRHQTQLPIQRLLRQHEYPIAAVGIPPPLSLQLQDGKEIYWGRAEQSRDPLSPNLTTKVVRLEAVLEEYPRLDGLRRVVLDRPRLHLYGLQGTKHFLKQSSP